MADRGRLQFTGEQAELIRVNVAERHTVSPDGPTSLAAALTVNDSLDAH